MCRSGRVNSASVVVDVETILYHVCQVDYGDDAYFLLHFFLLPSKYA
jgi:hypothetical protein